MALHGGLVWMVDGYKSLDGQGVYRDAADCCQLGMGDVQPSSPYSQAITRQVKATSKSGRPRVRSAGSNRPADVPHSKRFSLSNTKLDREPRDSYVEHLKKMRSQARGRSCVTPLGTTIPHRMKNSTADESLTVPGNLTPRSGSWSMRPSSGRHYTITTDNKLVVYEDLPLHPDLRYFDRHSKCFNHSHCSEELSATRPRTACAAGRSSLQQCQCCGEVTSQIRYRYAPSGSAMMEMQTNNKTFLYPERIFNYDSYTGRQRPKSAPAHTDHKGNTMVPQHNYVVRGDIPHFCNFVKSCSIYDKVTGEKIIDKDNVFDQLTRFQIEQLLKSVAKGDQPNNSNLLQRIFNIALEKRHAESSTRHYVSPVPQKPLLLNDEEELLYKLFSGADHKPVKDNYQLGGAKAGSDYQQQQSSQQDQMLTALKNQTNPLSALRAGIRLSISKSNKATFILEPPKVSIDKTDRNEEKISDIESLQLGIATSIKSFKEQIIEDLSLNFDPSLSGMDMPSDFDTSFFAESSDKQTSNMSQVMNNRLPVVGLEVRTPAVASQSGIFYLKPPHQSQSLQQRDASLSKSLKSLDGPNPSAVTLTVSDRHKRSLSSPMQSFEVELPKAQVSSERPDFLPKPMAYSTYQKKVSQYIPEVFTKPHKDQAQNNYDTLNDVRRLSASSRNRVLQAINPTVNQEYKHPSAYASPADREIHMSHTADTSMSRSLSKKSSDAKEVLLEDSRSSFSTSSDGVASFSKVNVLPEIPSTSKRSSFGFTFPGLSKVDMDSSSSFATTSTSTSESVKIGDTTKVVVPEDVVEPLAADITATTTVKSHQITNDEATAAHISPKADLLSQATPDHESDIPIVLNPYAVLPPVTKDAVEPHLGDEIIPPPTSRAPQRSTTDDRTTGARLPAQSLSYNTDTITDVKPQLTKPLMQKKTSISEAEVSPEPEKAAVTAKDSDVNKADSEREMSPEVLRYSTFGSVHRRWRNRYSNEKSVVRKKGVKLSTLSNVTAQILPAYKAAQRGKSPTAAQQATQLWENVLSAKGMRLETVTPPSGSPPVSPTRKSPGTSAKHSPTSMREVKTKVGSIHKELERLVTIVSPRPAAVPQYEADGRMDSAHEQEFSRHLFVDSWADSDFYLDKDKLAADEPSLQNAGLELETDTLDLNKLLRSKLSALQDDGLPPPQSIAVTDSDSSTSTLSTSALAPAHNTPIEPEVTIPQALVRPSVTQAQPLILQPLTIATPLHTLTPLEAPRSIPAAKQRLSSPIKAQYSVHFVNPHDGLDLNITIIPNESQPQLFHSQRLDNSMASIPKLVSSRELNVKSEIDKLHSGYQAATSEAQRIIDKYGGDWKSRPAGAKTKVKSGYHLKDIVPPKLSSTYKTRWASPAEVDETPPPSGASVSGLSIGSDKPVAPSITQVEQLPLGPVLQPSEIEGRLATVTIGESTSSLNLDMPGNNTKGHKKRPKSKTQDRDSDKTSKPRKTREWKLEDTGSGMDLIDPESKTSTDVGNEKSEDGSGAPEVVLPEDSLVTAVEELAQPSAEPSGNETDTPGTDTSKKNYSKKLGKGAYKDDDWMAMNYEERLNMAMRMGRPATAATASRQEFDEEPKNQRQALKIHAWMSGRLALSKQASRFELPMDVRVLEKMTPLEYLNKYCVVTSRRQMLYDRIYFKNKDGKTGKLGFSELQKALCDVLVHSIDDQHMKLVIDMLQITEDVVIDKKLFAGISAFAERLLYPMFARGGEQMTLDTQKEKIESADFYGLTWKLDGVNINQRMRGVFEVL